MIPLKHLHVVLIYLAVINVVIFFMYGIDKWRSSFARLLPKGRKKAKNSKWRIRQTVYPDLMAKYENPIEHTCDVREGQQWISENGKCPEGMCPSAWSSVREFVESLARGEGNFYDGWMKNPMSAMISCNDGFRPFSFYIEAIQ